MKYQLFDLTIKTVGDPKTFNCSHRLGDGIAVRGENIMFLPGTKQFSHYAFASLAPYIAAKQRATQKNDFMYFESEIACPDPLCGARFSITRESKKMYVYTPIVKRIRNPYNC